MLSTEVTLTVAGPVEEEDQTPENTPAAGLPTIGGTAQVGATLMADASGIADGDGMDNAEFSYQWLADDSDIAGATASTYILVTADQGKTIKAKVSFTDDAGNRESLTSEATAEVAARPNSPATRAPTISGTAQVGETLTADTSGIADAEGVPGAFTYIWYTTGDSDTPTRVKISTYWPTYRLRADDKGKTVTVQVKFTDGSGAVESLTSEPTAAVVGVDRTERPHDLTATVSGDAIVLTWKDAVNVPNHNAYQILRHRPELGESEPLVYMERVQSKAPTFTDTEVEPGALYVYQVKAVVDWFGSLGEASGPAEIRMPATEETNSPATGAPTISGNARVGETLTVDVSGIADAYGLDDATFSYQWLADGADIPSATGSSYTPVDADVGKVITVKVSFTDAAGNDETLTSAATAAVAAAANSPATGTPTITGTAQVGETLTAGTVGIADAAGLDAAVFTYQWLADDADIQDATDSTYTLVTTDVGKNIGVRVSFTDDRNNAETLTSAQTEAVTVLIWSATITVGSGEGYSGYSLTQNTGELSPDEFSFGVIDYSVKLALEGDDGLLYFALDRALPTPFTLHIGPIRFASEDASTRQENSGYTYQWDKGSVDWSDGEDVELTLTMPDTPLVVSLENAPASHSGADVFTFDIRFSEEFPLSYRTLKFDAFTVAGGEVLKAQRSDPDKTSNVGWKITVRPNSNGDVEIELPVTTDCGATGAICAEDGRMLSNSLNFTVSGPGQ